MTYGNKRRAAARRMLSAETLERRFMLSGNPVGSEFLVNTYTTSRQFAPAIAIDADGDFVATWASFGQDGSDAGVFAQRFGASGQPQGPEIRVNSYTTFDQTAPALALAPDGSFVIAWMSQFQAGSFGSDIYAQRFDAVGEPVGGEFRVNAYTPGNQIAPAIAIDSDGDFVIAWSGEGSGDGDGVFAQRYNAQGVAQGGELAVNTHTPTRQWNTSIATDPDGNFTIAWTSQVQDGSGHGVYAQRFSAAGLPRGNEFRVNGVTDNDQASPDVAVAADGSFVITWMSDGQDGHLWGIVARRFDEAGNPIGNDFLVNAYTSSFQMQPSIAMDAAGDFVIAWESIGPSGAGLDIYARNFDATGAPQGDQFPVNTTTNAEQQTAAVAMGAAGNFVIAWHDNRNDDGLDGGVFAQRFESDAEPAVLASTFDFAGAPHRLRFTFDRDVSATLGTDDLVVHNLTSGQTLPAGDFSLSYDSTSNVATFTYTGGGATSGVLADGNYRATLLAAGTTLPADHVFEFFFLSGDATRDGLVNLADFNILAQNFGQSDRTFAQGDFNYDGVVNLADFNILASRFGIGLGDDDRDD